jgi:hypothetical protein
MTDLDHTCMTAIESGRMARVALTRFKNVPEAEANGGVGNETARTAAYSPGFTGNGGAAKQGGRDVDGSASARPSGQGIGAQPPGVDGGMQPSDCASGPDGKRAPHPKRYLRPYCQHRDMCRSGTSDHCGACRRAIQEAGK